MKKDIGFFAVNIRILVLLTILINNQCSGPEQPREDVAPRYKMEASSLYEAFSKNQEEANQKYLGKIVEVSGPLASFQIDSLNNAILFLLDDLFGIHCSMDSTYIAHHKEEFIGLSPGEELRIKGKCNGLQTDIQLSECIILNSMD